MNVLRLGAIGSLVLLILINLANYIDRFLVVALGDLIKAEFKLTDDEQGLLLSIFVIVYMVSSPLCGWIADRVARRWVIGSAVALWSLATALGARAPSFPLLLSARGAVGIGESGYNAAGQALLADLFPVRLRNKVMAAFNAAVPVGGAIGYLLGGFLPELTFGGHELGWRGACLWVGLPGLLLAFAAIALPNPKPGSAEAPASPEEDPTRPDSARPAPDSTPVSSTPVTGAQPEAHGHPAGGSPFPVYLELLRDRIYLTNALGYAMQGFAIGGLSNWAASFFIRTHSLPHNKADMLAGGVVAAAGLLGTIAGTFLADVLAKGNLVRSYALVTGVGYLAAGPLLALGLLLPFEPAIVCFFLAMVGTFLGTGPTNAIVSERAPAAHRASAFALLIVIIHLFGDAASPYVVGRVSASLTAGGLGEAQSLQRALILTPVALVLGGVLMVLCALAAHREGAGNGKREGAEKTVS